MEYDLTLFEKGLEELGIALSQEQKKQFITYYEYLVEKNKVMNLTAITEYNEVILKHFLDSLSIVKVGSFDQKKLTESREQYGKIVNKGAFFALTQVIIICQSSFAETFPYPALAPLCGIFHPSLGSP
ncbi:MAG: RsmG family class I SAM-dependent methyltransferase [Ruminococcus sp.]